MANEKSTHNVFISHHNKDQEDLNNLTDLMGRNGYQLRNSSIDESKPNNANSEEYIKSILRDRIKWAGTVLVLIGKETASRPWVNWEIEYANSQGKRIVGVYVRGAQESDIPENLDRYGNAIVGWDSGNLLKAVQGEYNDSVTPDGAPRVGPWTPERSNC